MGTLTSVTWSVWLIGGPNGATGSHRVKLPGGGTNSSVQKLAGDTDHPNTCQWTIDTPPLESGRFSVLRRSLRHGSPKGLPGPFYVLGGVVIAVQAGSAVRATMPTDG